MRPNLAVLTLLAVGVIAAAVNAAPDKVTSPFVDDALNASIVEGDATLNPNPARGEVMIHASLRGLEPSTQYVAVILDASVTCGVGTTIEQFTFETNPAGVANWNRKVTGQLSDIESIAIRLQTTDEPVACADFPLN